MHGQGGPSKLTQMLNSYLGAMAQEVLGHNGDILKFSGDAFFCMWKTDETFSLSEVIHDAIDCAIFIQRRCGSYLTDVGVTLRVKISVSAGPVIFSIIGNEKFSHYVVVGTPIWELKEAQEHTNSGEVVVSQSAWNYALAYEYLFVDMRDGKHYKVHGFSSKWNSSSRRRNQQEVISLHEDKIFSFISTSDGRSGSTSTSGETDRLPFSLSQFYNDEIEGFTQRPTVDTAIKNNLREKLGRFIIPPVMRGIELNEPLEFLTEVRHVVILIVNIIIKETILEKVVNLVKETFDIIFRIVDETKGCVNKVSLFDKDYMILCIFGLRGMKSNLESQMALQCGHEIRQNLIRLPEIETVSCAITTGLTYCGVVGYTLRLEYTVISMTVNKAARLMVAYPNQVTCDRETFLYSKLEAKNFILQKHIKLKGFSNVEPFYEYREQVLLSGKKYEMNHYPLLDRELEINLYLDLINNFVTKKEFKDTHDGVATVNTTIGLIIRGESKQGKTSLLNELILMTPTKIPVNHFCLQFKDSQVPYTTIRIIFGLTVSLNDEQKFWQEREQKLTRYLSKIKMSEFYLCAFNDIFQVRFEYSDLYRNLSQHERHQVRKQLFGHLFGACFPSLWVFALDHAEFIDNKSWILLSYMFGLEQCFTILIVGQRKSISVNGTKVIKRLKIKEIVLRPISKWYHAALACQMLNVRAIPVELERIIQTRSNGNPGWIKNYLITLDQVKAIVIQSIPKKDIVELGLVAPPIAMLTRNQSVLKESLSTQTNRKLRDDNWKMFKQCFVDSGSILPQNCNDYLSGVGEHLDMPVCQLASQFKVDDFNSEYNTINTFIMRTFDSLSPYEQHLLKCSSILGERFLRTMLLYVMLLPASPFQAASAVKKLFDIKVLVCARGNFDYQFRLILESNNNCVDFDEETEELCHCQGLKYDDTCNGLPKYAECGYMKFESHLFQETVYSLLTDHQKKEVHGRAIRYLENNARRCQMCGSGYFNRFIGISRYQTDHWNRNQIMYHLDEIIHEENTSIGPAVVQTSAGFSFDDIQSSYLIFDPMSFEKVSKSATVNTVKFYNLTNRNQCCKSNKSNVKDFDISKLPKFSDKNLVKCQCISIYCWMYTQFIIHLRGAGRYDKLIECQLDYANLCIENFNIPMALKLLDDAKSLLTNQIIYDEDNVYATWLIPIHNGRIHMLTGYAKFRLQEFKVAVELMHVAMSYFGEPFPKTKLGIHYALKKQQYRQKLLFQYPERFIHTQTGKYGEFCGILSDCLAIFYELHKAVSEWDSVRLAGIWCLNEALRSGQLSFHSVCKAYAIMIEVCTRFDMPGDLLQILSLQLCSKRRYLIETHEFRSVLMLYKSILFNRFVKGKMYDAKKIGYVMLDLARKLHDSRAAQETLQMLIDVLIHLMKFTEVVQNITELYHYSMDYCDAAQRMAYYTNCIGFTLASGYTLLDCTQVQQYLKLEDDALEHEFYSDGEKRFFLTMWSWYIRHSNWDAAILYNSQVESIVKQINIGEQYNLVDQWLVLQFLEGLLITLVHNANMHYIEKVRQLQQQINKIFKCLDIMSRKILIFTPRYYHLKAYHLKINNVTHPKVDKLLQLGKEVALKVNNVYEHAFICHHELYWSHKLRPESIHHWRTSSLLTQDWRILLEDHSKIIYFTYPLPCKPIST